MIRVLSVIIFIMLINSSFINKPNPIGNHVFKELKNDDFRQGRDIALFFVVEDYDHWDKLKFPIDDAEEIAGILERDYDFETQIVRNPTWNTIDKTLRQYIKRSYAKDAQLLIWFGGHGDFDSVLERGYFIAKDGGKDTRAKWFSFTDLEQYLKKINCEHILLSIDACYSGTFDQALAMRGPPKFGRPNPAGLSERDRFVQEELELRTRLFIASGKKERVPDRSDFATYFKRALRQHGERIIWCPFRTWKGNLERHDLSRILLALQVIKRRAIFCLLEKGLMLTLKMSSFGSWRLSLMT